MTRWVSGPSHILVFTWEFANSSESIRKFSHQVISRFDALGFWCSCCGWFFCSCCLSGCCACQASVGLSGPMTAQFTWTTANLSHAGRPRRAGPGVSATYQYEWIMVWLGSRSVWLPEDGATEDSIQRNQRPIVGS